jgi:hypothetical protein
VLRDVLDEVITPAQAEADYAVAVDVAARAVDERRTAELRAR